MQSLGGKRGKLLSFEQLEPRRMLVAVHVVYQHSDNGTGLVGGTLSRAIKDANAHAIVAPAELNVIRFQFNDVSHNDPYVTITALSQSLPTITAANVTIDGFDTQLTTADQRVIVQGNGAQNILTSLRYDGTASAVAGHFEVLNLRFDRIEGDAIRVIGLGVDDRVTIDNVDIQRSSPAFDVNGQPTLGSGSGVYFAATPSGPLGRFEITNSYFYRNASAGIVIDSVSPPAATIATNSITNNIIGYTPGTLSTSGNGIDSPGVRLGSGASRIDILSNGIYTATKPAIEVTASAASAIRVGTDQQNSPNVFESASAYLSHGSPFDLLADGLPLANDGGDGDSGPNDLQNRPSIVMDGLTFSGTAWTIPVRLDSQPGDYRLDVYRQDAASKKWSYIQGQTSTFSSPTTMVNVTVAATAVTAGQFLAIVATGQSVNVNNTSEFTPFILDATAPRVADLRLFSVNPNGTPAWTLSAYSFNDLVPAGKQLAPIFTQNINQLQVVFSEGIQESQLTNANVKLFRSNGEAVALPAAPVYNSATRTATWTLDSTVFGGFLPADKYRLEISTSVTDLAGKSLDGDWMNLTNSTPDKFDDDPVGRTLPSGDGSPGSTNNRFEFWFSVLPGDRNQDGLVNNSDLSFNGDVNGDGSSTPADTSIVQGIINSNTAVSLPLRDRLVDYFLRGDYNDNDGVGQDDYAKWKATFGSTTNLAADGSGNGIVDAADYSPWRDNLGKYSAWYTGPIPQGSGGGSGSGIPVFDPNNFPRVANVTISGSGSAHAPFSFNGPNDNTDFDGSGIQLRTVPVGGADTISITFTEDVNITADTLKLTGMRTANRPVLADFSYDLGTMTARWRFSSWALGDQYLISLSDAITDVEGNSLDGEWKNPVQLSTVNAAVSEFPSGDGYQGGDFNFVVTLLPGDANLDGLVNSTDYYIFSSHTGANALFTLGDFNGDGQVSYSGDGQILVANFNLNLSGPIALLADLNGDRTVDDDDLNILASNVGSSNPTKAQGNLDGDTDIDIHDLDLMFAQFGLELEVVS